MTPSSRDLVAAQTRLFVDLDLTQLDEARAARFHEVDLAAAKHQYLHLPTHLVIRGNDVLLPPWLPPGGNRASVFYTLTDLPSALEWTAYERTQSWELAEGGHQVTFTLDDGHVHVSTHWHTEPLTCGLIELVAACLRFADEMRNLLLEAFPELAYHEGLVPWLNGTVPFPRSFEDEHLWQHRRPLSPQLRGDVP